MSRKHLPQEPETAYSIPATRHLPTLRRLTGVALWLLVLLMQTTDADEQPSVVKSRTSNGPVTALALSPDEQFLLVADHAGLEVLSLSGAGSGMRKSFEVDHLDDLEFLPDGSLLAVAGGTPGQFGIVEILRWPTLERAVVVRDFDEVVTSVAWSPDGGYLAAGCHDSVIRICEPVSGKIVATASNHSRAITDLAWTKIENDQQSGSVLISTSLDQSVRVFELKADAGSLELTQLRVLDQHTREVQGLTVARGASRFQNGKLTVATWGDDRTLRFWQPSNGRLLRFARLDHEVAAAAWDNAGRSVFAALTSGALVQISLETAKVNSVKETSTPVTKMLFQQQPAQVIAGDLNGQIHTRKGEQFQEIHPVSRKAD